MKPRLVIGRVRVKALTLPLKHKMIESPDVAKAEPQPKNVNKRMEALNASNSGKK